MKQKPTTAVLALLSVAPLLGVAFTFLFLGGNPNLKLFFALAVLVAGTVVMAKESLVGEHLNG
ncbi:hypothetical protein BM477_06185 [Boudabousia marimammalium]|uniref:Uncharacterized protein n=1 Tax=Boudabousia marimammalium TaxID=156892 RepID=A0A1Q5PLX0_9ACTO|nr:hypothetical protein BM477_06185 [Boudabousia marimammalium]